MSTRLKDLVRDLVIAEARKAKKGKKKEEKETEKSPGYQHAEALDFSKPLGDWNVYRHQGVANWGPYTSQGVVPENIVEDFRGSAWEGFAEEAPGNIWEALERVSEDFSSLKKKLAHKKGVTDPAALAASIGRKKLGSKEMARRSVAGRKKKG